MPTTSLATLLSLALLALAGAGPAGGAALRDGKRFDPAAKMTAPAAGAPEQLARMLSTLGQWDVELTTFGGEGEPRTGSGLAEITLMNRGHGFMERFHSTDFDGAGQKRSSIAFLTYNPGTEQWVRGEGDSFTESARMANGRFEDERLVLRDAERRRGGMQITHVRYTTELRGAEAFATEIAESTDGESWTTRLRKSYTRRLPADDFLAPASDYGSPAPGLPPEARQFDFLIGSWTSTHDMTLPNGQNPKWTANDTAVYALDGHAVMEFNWFDVDPSLPDAATTILRIYNRAMRRWECLFMPNRGNNLLLFGGHREGDEVVLTLFGNDRGDPRMSRFVFHDMHPDRYSWYGETSTDHGATFNRFWIIDATRKPTVEPAPPSGE